MELLTLSWDEIYRTCLRLAKDITNDGFKVDCIIGISRGGLIPSRIFADIFDIHDIFIITARYYKGINERLEKPIIKINADMNNLKNKNILVIDDIVDTGTTMTLLAEMINKHNNIKTLTLYKKPISSFEPDYYASISDKWIVFPWERCETLRMVIKHEEDPRIVDIDKEEREELLAIINGDRYAL